MAEISDTPEPHDPPAPLLSPPLTRRAMPAPERPSLPPDIEERFGQLLQTVQILSAHFFGETDPAESPKERTARRVRKFQRERISTPPGEDTGTESPKEDGESAVATDDATDPLSLNKSIAWPRQSPTVPTAARAAAPWWQRHPVLGWWLGAQAFVVVLLTVGYLLGRTNIHSSTGKGSGRATGDLFGQPELTEQAFRTANDALHAEHAGDAEGARKIYENAVNKHVELVGMNYRLALLAVQRNDRLEAEQRLARSVADGEDIADCCYVLARLAADKGDLEEPSNQFEKAARTRPLEGKYFFYWAEVLRRQGKPQAAVTAFEQALDRPYTAANGDLYLFKERLAKLEFGHDDAFNAELAARLAQPPVAAEWLLLAAARDIDRQAYAAAAEYLRQAADRMPSTLYADLTHDYVFQAQAKRSELAGWLDHVPTVSVSSAGPTVLDPGSWPPERGDPGIWPPARSQGAP